MEGLSEPSPLLSPRPASTRNSRDKTARSSFGIQGFQDQYNENSGDDDDDDSDNCDGITSSPQIVVGFSAGDVEEDWTEDFDLELSLNTPNASTTAKPTASFSGTSSPTPHRNSLLTLELRKCEAEVEEAEDARTRTMPRVSRHTSASQLLFDYSPRLRKSLHEAALVAAESTDSPRQSITLEEGFADSSSEEEDEDWDTEMGFNNSDDEVDEINLGSLVNGIKDLVVTSDMPHNKGSSGIHSAISRGGSAFGSASDLAAVVPRRCRIVSLAINKSALKIVRYPKPSGYYSLHSEGFLPQGEKQLESWLSTLVLSKCDSYLLKDKEDVVTKEIEENHKLLSDLETLYSFLWKLTRRTGEKERFQEKVLELMAGLNKHSTAAADLEHSDSALFILEILDMTAIQWSPVTEFDNGFSVRSFFETTLRVFPQYALVIALIEVRATAHHVESLLLPGAKYKWVCFNTESSSILTSNSDEASLLQFQVPLRIMDRYISLYETAVASTNSSRSTDKNWRFTTDTTHIQAQVLADLYYCSINVSPLTGSSGSHWLSSMTEDEEDESMLGDEMQFDDDAMSEAEETAFRLYTLRKDGRYRMELLLELYPALSTDTYPAIKGVVAQALAHFVMHTLQQMLLAESLALESLVLLDSSTILPRNVNHMLLTPVGTSGLELYGDILIHNNKYRYGILAFEAAIASFKARENREYDRLSRRLCSICLQFRDTQRAFPLHLKILQSARESRNVNEFVYISEVVSKMLLEQGKFLASEDYIKAASSFLREIVVGLPPAFDSDNNSTHVLATNNDPRRRRRRSSLQPESGKKKAHRRVNSGDSESSLIHHYNLHLELCNIYRTSGQLSTVGVVLRMLLGSKLPPGKRADVLMLLAENYLKCRQLHDCYGALLLLAKDASEACYATSDNVVDYEPSPWNPMLGVLHRKGSNRGNCDLRLSYKMVNSYRYLRCRARCHLYAHDGITALHWIAFAIATAVDTSNVGVLGNLYYLKGRAFNELRHGGHHKSQGDIGQAQMDAKCDKWLDDALSEEGQKTYEEVIGGLCRPVFDEALVSFSKAYDYFCALDDVLHQTKTLIAIVELRHSTVFEEVCIKQCFDNSRVLEALSNSDLLCVLAMEHCGDLCNPMTTLRCCTVLAELHWIFGANRKSTEAWFEAVSVLRGVYVQPVRDSSSTSLCFLSPLLGFSPGLLSKLYEVLSRLLRLAFCYASPRGPAATGPQATTTSGSSTTSGNIPPKSISESALKNILVDNEDLMTLWLYLDTKMRTIHVQTSWRQRWYSQKLNFASPSSSSSSFTSPSKFFSSRGTLSSPPPSRGRTGRHRKTASVGSNWSQSVGDAFASWFKSEKAPVPSNGEDQATPLPKITPGHSRSHSSGGGNGALSSGLFSPSFGLLSTRSRDEFLAFEDDEDEDYEEESVGSRRRASSEPHSWNKSKVSSTSPTCKSTGRNVKSRKKASVNSASSPNHHLCNNIVSYLHPELGGLDHHVKQLGIDIPMSGFASVKASECTYVLDPNRRMRIWGSFHRLRLNEERYSSRKISLREYAENNVGIVGEILGQRPSSMPVENVERKKDSFASLPVFRINRMLLGKQQRSSTSRHHPGALDSPSSSRQSTMVFGTGMNSEDNDDDDDSDITMSDPLVHFFQVGSSVFRYQGGAADDERIAMKHICNTDALRSASIFSINVSERPPNRNDAIIYHLLSLFGPKNVLKLLSSTLLQNPVLIIGRDLNTVRCVTQAILRLLRPFTWPHTCIPLLPPSSKTILMQALENSAPFVIGISASTYAEVRLDLSIDSRTAAYSIPEKRPTTTTFTAASECHDMMHNVAGHVTILDLDSPCIVFPVKSMLVPFPDKMRKSIVEAAGKIVCEEQQQQSSRPWLGRFGGTSTKTAEVDDAYLRRIASRVPANQQQNTVSFQLQLLKAYTELIQGLLEFNSESKKLPPSIPKAHHAFLKNFGSTSVAQSYFNMKELVCFRQHFNKLF